MKITLDTFLHSGKYRNIELEVMGGMRLPYQDYRQPKTRDKVELYFLKDCRTSEYEAYRDVDLDLDITEELESGSPLLTTDVRGEDLIIHFKEDTNGAL